MGIASDTVYTIKGSTDLVEYKPVRVWDPERGVQTLRRFAGPREKIRARFSELAAAGSSSGVDEMQEELNGQAGELLCRIYDDSGGESGGNTEALNSVWELYATDILKPIENHTDFNAITRLRKREIENYVRDAAQYPTTLANATEKKLAGYYAEQVLDFMLTQFILRRTLTVSIRSTTTIDYSNTNYVLTIGAINPPALLLGSLASLPKMDGKSGAWQWLKKAPQVLQVGKRRWQLRYEWHGAEQWADIYENGTWSPTYE